MIPLGWTKEGEIRSKGPLCFKQNIVTLLASSLLGVFSKWKFIRKTRKHVLLISVKERGSVSKCRRNTIVLKQSTWKRSYGPRKWERNRDWWLGFFFFLSQSLFGTKEVSPRKMSVCWAFSYLYQAAWTKHFGVFVNVWVSYFIFSPVGTKAEGLRISQTGFLPTVMTIINMYWSRGYTETGLSADPEPRD